MSDATEYLIRARTGVMSPIMNMIVYLIIVAYAQDVSNSTMCVPFPHSHLLCGQYINASTMVYIDPNVFNYTEANNRITELDNKELVFTTGSVTSCRWIIIYTACLSIYPRCSISTQSLVPPCMDDCLEYAARCRRHLIGVSTFVMNSNNPLDETFIFNCSRSTPFRAFGSVSIDTENCYNFNFSPIFVRSTNPIIESNNDTRLIVLSDQNSSTEYCSELQSKIFSVACRAVGIPEPQVKILINGTIVEPFNGTENEVVIRLAPTIFGEVVVFECQASTMTITTSITVNLSYTCCMNDTGAQHSIGEALVTTDCRQCFCGNGGSISCDQSQCESNNSGISTGIIVVIILVVALVIGVIVIVIGYYMWWSMKRTKKKMPEISVKYANSKLEDNHSCTNAETKLTNQYMSGNISTDNSDFNNIRATNVTSNELKPSDSASPYLSAASSVPSLAEVLTSKEPEEFKPTEDLVITALNDHLLEDFIVSHDHLNILEILGEGAFGKVFHGFLTKESDQTVEVAVKTIKEYQNMDELNSFISESVIMKDFKHRNVLGLIGVSVGVEGDIAAPYIILPYMVNGDLKGYLQHKRNEAQDNPESLLKEISYLTLVKMCCDICHGMEYLASIRYVHRDLAARNCMVGEDLVVKVADFGLSRDIYSDEYYRLTHNAPLPIKWMPLESLYDRYFNQMTDVWAFGVCCWEVFSLGKAPYAGVEIHNIIKYIASGNRLSKTALCGAEMYQIMLGCWELKNSDRPTFATLAEQIDNHYSNVLESDPSNPSSPYHNLFIESAYVNWKAE